MPSNVFPAVSRTLAYPASTRGYTIGDVKVCARPGATEDDLDRLAQRLNVRVPDAFRVIYRFHDGQHFAPPFAFWGLFGW